MLVKSRLRGCFLKNFAWTVVLALLAVSAARAEERKIKPFGSLDLFAPGNGGDGFRDDAQAAVNQLAGAGYSSSGSVETKTAVGGRIGVATAVNPSLDLGLSVGYIAGPNSDATVNISGGGLYGVLADQREVHFVRFLFEPRLNVPINDRSSFHFGAGLGVAQGTVEDTFTCSGSACLTSGQKTSSTWSGFTWEVSPYLSFGNLTFGLRYAAFPPFKGSSNNHAKMDWSTIGFFAGFEF